MSKNNIDYLAFRERLKLKIRILSDLPINWPGYQELPLFIKIKKEKKNYINLDEGLVFSAINFAAGHYKDPIDVLIHPRKTNAKSKSFLKSLKKNLECLKNCFRKESAFNSDQDKFNQKDAIEHVVKIIDSQYVTIANHKKRRPNHGFRMAIAQLACHFIIDCLMPAKEAYSLIAALLNTHFDKTEFEHEHIRKYVRDENKYQIKVSKG